NTIKLIKKDSTPHSAIHPQLAEVVVFLHFKDKSFEKKEIGCEHSNRRVQTSDINCPIDSII
ncbi:hypothetical protein, partial [uncultured Methanobrevibacter sp.]|uniref:hypothetical protein n=1 Tax=uncultured Methanobrevibacter sp. TaxID=253161 RepID=UPI0025ED9DFF